MVRWAKLPTDDAVETERHKAEKAATRAALQALPIEAQRLGVDPDLVATLEAEYRMHVEALGHVDGGPTTPAGLERPTSTPCAWPSSRTSAPPSSSCATTSTSTTALREIQAQLDAEEVGLSRGLLASTE